MRKTIISMAVLVLMCFQICRSAAADPDVVRESDKADAVKRIMAGRKFYPRQPEKPFCGQFLEDFPDLKDMSFVETVARADTYDDPVLDPYKARCGELPLNEKFECDPRATQDVKWSKDPKEKRRQYLKYCHVYSGTANFKVFELDIDNDPKNGKELIMYFERAVGSDFRGDNVYGDGGYNIFDSRSCGQMPGARTHDPYSYFWKRSLENYNGIMLYQNRYYIIDLADLDGSDRDPDNPNYSLHLFGVGPDRRGQSCSYSTIPPFKPMKKGGS